MFLLRESQSHTIPHFRADQEKPAKIKWSNAFVVLVLILTIFAILYSRLTPIVSEMAVAGAKTQ